MSEGITSSPHERNDFFAAWGNRRPCLLAPVDLDKMVGMFDKRPPAIEHLSWGRIQVEDAVSPYKDAVDKYNELRNTDYVGALIHSTC